MAIDRKNLSKAFASLLCKASVFSVIAFPQSAFCSISFFTPDYKEEDQPKASPQVDSRVEHAASAVELDSRLEFGANYTYLSFKPHGHQSFNGNLGGMQALYEYRPMNRFYGAAKFAWREGETHGSAGRRSILYFDAHQRLGYTFAPEKKDWSLTLFSGFGYRHLGEKLKPKEGHSIHFRYNEFYFPVGLLTHYDVTSWFSFGVDFTWMPQVYPTVTIAPLKGARWILTNTFANFLVEIPLTFTLTKNKRFLLILTPSYERWQDGHTTAKLSDGTSLGLPGNTYNFYGANLNFAYCF